MKPRRRSRLDHTRARSRTLQRIRLERIARGEAEPVSEREEHYQWTLQHVGHADPADFIVPWPLLLVETVELLEARAAGEES